MNYIHHHLSPLKKTICHVLVDLRGYKPERANFKVFGRRKWTDVRTFDAFVFSFPLTTFFFAFKAALAEDLLFAIVMLIVCWSQLNISDYMKFDIFYLSPC